MALSNAEREVIEKVIARLSADNTRSSREVREALANEHVRLWLDSWIIPALRTVAKPAAERARWEMPAARS